MNKTTLKLNNVSRAQIIKSAFMITFLTAFAFISKATHLIGGQITYTHTTGSTYHVKLSVYRDCDGIALGTSQTIVVTNATTGGSVTSFTVSQVSVVPRTTVCPGQSTTCTNPSSSIDGVEEHYYEGDVTLPSGVAGYTLAWSQNARANGVTNLVNPGGQSMYFSSYLLHDPSINNNSSTFLSLNMPDFCTGQPAVLSLNAADPDGDQIVYSLINTRSAANTNCTYQAGLSGLTPIVSSTPVVINPSTGVITFTPSATNQRCVFAIRAEEFRGGVKVGEIFRDFEVRTSTCSNNVPVIAPIANLTVQVGQTVCIPISATDADNDNVTLSAVSAIIPPGTFTLGSVVPGMSQATFCFTATAANAGNTYNVTVSGVDNHCPSPGVATATFTVTVPGNTSVPTISEWGLIILALISLSIGMVFILRRKQNAIA